ncbi:MAG: chemotaxis protein [Pseudomonadota bacterium]
MLTQHSGSQSLQLLLFRLSSGRLLGINLLKVQEIIPCPNLTQLPKSHAHVSGVAQLRGNALVVIDLSRAIGDRVPQDPRAGCLIITELSRSKQGLHVQSVEKIVYCDPRDVRPPPAGTGSRAYITGVTEIAGALVQILDIERILHELAPPSEQVGAPLMAAEERALLRGRRALVVDDSTVALHQTVNTLRALEIDCVPLRNGKEALAELLRLAGAPEAIEILVSDIEMPEMDGYELTRGVRTSPTLQGLYVLLHTSLDSTMNTDKARQAGADDVLTKFSASELTKALLRAARSIQV